MNTHSVMNPRRQSAAVQVGDVVVGGGAPIVVQAMTDTDTADVDATAKQAAALFNAGAQLVRITVNTPAAARAVPAIRERLDSQNIAAPLVGDFHYNGHKLLSQFAACAESLAKYRINPGNVGRGEKRDKNFAMMIEAALRHDKPVRIGGNWGSLDQEMLADMMDENGRRKNPLSADEVLRDALVESVLRSAARAQELGLPPEKIVLSAKVSRLPALLDAYQRLAARCQYALHIGLTEAGMGLKGAAASAAAMALLLQQGIGDTIRASLTPRPGQPRTDEVRLCCELLQAMELASFAPAVAACPGCGRTAGDFFRRLADDIQRGIDDNMPAWRARYPGVENLKIAVMGCVVNGPGESRHADIGISLPGSGEDPVAPVFIDGEKAAALKGENIAAQFKEMLAAYIHRRFAGSESESESASNSKPKPAPAVTAGADDATAATAAKPCQK